MRVLKSTLLLLGALAFLFSSCTREEEGRPGDTEGTVFTLKASFAEAGAKAEVGSDGSCYWQAGDKIAVYDAVGGNFCEFTTEAGDGVFTFTGAPGASYDFTHAYYPASFASGARAITLPDSYSVEDVQTTSAFPVTGNVDNGSIKLCHLTALLKYTIKGIPATASSIELSSPTVSLSGNFPVEGSSLDDGWVSADGENVTDHDDVSVKSMENYPEIHAQAGSATVRISLVPGSNDNLTFYLPLPVGAYAFTTRIKAGEEILYENTTTSLKDIYRAHLVQMYPFKPGFGGGTGTASSPYLISTKAHLMELSGTTDPDFLSACYLQTADIDLAGASFSPCGTSSAPFSGFYDADGHSISNLSVSVAGDNAGLFGSISGGTVKNLTIASSSVSASGQNAGSIAGLLTNGGRISACRVDAASTVTSGARAAGSIVGKVVGGIIDNCASHGNVTGYDCVGGIAGFLNPNGTNEVLVINCVYEPVYEAGKMAKAVLQSSNTSAYIGGISGAANASGGSSHVSVVNCYAYPLEMRSTQATGTTGVWFVGGILGRMVSSNVDLFNCISPITYSNVIIGGTRLNAKTMSSYSAMSCIVGQVNADGCTIRRAYSKKTWPYCYRLTSGKSVTTSDISLKMGDSNMRGYHNVMYSSSHPISGVLGYSEADGGIAAALNEGVKEWNNSSPAVPAVNWAYYPTFGYPKPEGVDVPGIVTRKVSIIGDSISTYEGYIFSTDLAGMGKFYPDTGNYGTYGDAMVLNEQDTWWWHIIHDYMSNTRLEVCNAWGGTTTSYFTSNITVGGVTAEAYARSMENSLQSRNLDYGLGHPDILIYYGGRNDFGYVGNNSDILLGSFTDESLQAAFDAPQGSKFNNYSQGTVAILKDFHTKNPGAKIVIVLHDLMDDGYEDAATAVRAFLEGKGYDIRFVNLHKRGTTNSTNTEIGVSKENGSHPNKAGCANIASYFVNQLGTWLEE